MDQHPVYRFDDFSVDPGTWKLSRDGREIHVEPMVLKLLIYLIDHRGRLVTREELMSTVWGDTVISEAALTKAVARLRRALDDHSDTPRYLETVRSQGYRFVAEVEETVIRDAPAAAENRGRSPGRWIMASAAAVIVLLGLAYFWPRAPRETASRPDAITSLAVLPLSNLTGDAGQEAYADGLQELLVAELSRLPGLRVTSRQSTRRYRDSRLPAHEIAAELGVDGLLEGSLRRDGGEIEVAVQLIHGPTESHLWAERYTREAPLVFSLVTDVARAVAAEIDEPLASATAGGPANGARGPFDPRAVDAYAQGLRSLDQYAPGGVQAAIEQFRKAVEIEPEFALAWGQLTAAYAMQGLYGFAPPRESIEKARDAALNAIEADPRSYIGHSGLGWVRLWTGDFERGCASIEEAIRLNPSDPYAIHGVAECLMLEGRVDESLEQMRNMLLVSPFSVMQSRGLPYHLFLARRFDEAVAAVDDVRARLPGVPMHYLLAWVYWKQGEFERAIEEERMELERRGDTVLLEALDEGLAAGGPTGALRATAQALVERSKERYVDPFEIGKTFARAGMVDEALLWLNRAVDYGSYEITYLAFRPDLDAIRGDPRYEALLERIYGERIPPTGGPASR